MSNRQVSNEEFYIRLLNLEAQQEFKKRQTRKICLAGFILFFLLMAGGTLAARIRYAEELPEIKWNYALSSSLKQKITLPGIIRTESPEIIYGLEGLRPVKIHVSSGEMVEPGMALFEVDTEDLQKKIEELSAVHSTWKRRYENWYEDARTDEALYEAGQREMQIAQWQELLAAHGKLLAEEAGMILEVKLETGYRMEEIPIITYCTENTEMNFQAIIDEKQKSLMHIGDLVTIKLAQSKKNVDAEINWIEEQNGNYLVTVHLPKGEGYGETEGIAEVNYSSPVYEYVIPMEAVHTVGERCCIYVLKETEGILGVEMTADQMDVRILEQSYSHVAIEEEILEKDTKIIISSDKALSDGMTVREEG